MFYTRDSLGQHEMTPGEYVRWAQGRANDLGVSFGGTPEGIDNMIRTSQSASGDIFLDYGVSGNILTRQGLTAMVKEALADPSVSHIFIPRRDRLARPDNPLDGVSLEDGLRGAGITLVFMDKVCPPLHRGQRRNTADLFMAMLDYDRSGQYRRDLAQNIIYAQIRLASLGFSTGGRPPYGFRRWLVREDGTAVRELMEKEKVRMPGHHVFWLPGPEEELDLIRRILEMLETMPAGRVADVLNRERIPSPDANRIRKVHGVLRPTRGRWNHTTITNIARNPLLLAMRSYGRRSVGDQLRFDRNGPRELTDEDYRSDRATDQVKPKVIRNPEANQIVSAAKFDPLVDTARHQRLLAKLDERGGRQRGKPRARGPAENPLGCRVFDMNCTWPMYRNAYNGSYRYRCGLYQQTHGAECSHNHVDGPTAKRFVLSCVRQRLLSPTLMKRLEQRLTELAEHESAKQGSEQETARKSSALAKVRADMEKVSRNLALAENPDQYRAVAAVFEDLKQREALLTRELAELQSSTGNDIDMASEVRKTLELAERLAELANREGAGDRAAELFRLSNARLFLAFSPVQLKKQVRNRITGGVVTFGAASPPIQIHEGPTDHRKLTAAMTSAEADSRPSAACDSHECTMGSGQEVESLRNVQHRGRI